MTLIKRGQVLSQPPHYRTGCIPVPQVSQVLKDTARALLHAKQDRSNAVSKRAA
mgnify:CR=1 FL=1